MGLRNAADKGRLVNVAGRWPLRALKHRAKLLDFATWEKEFVTIFMENVKPRDVVFDVGAEDGEFSALAAKITGGSRVHMFEPRRQVWNNIRTLWGLNGLGNPGGCWAGFASDRTSEPAPDKSAFVPWPKPGAKEERGLQLHTRFERLLCSNGIPSLAIDDYVKATGASPTVIIMDIEGAEVLALRGALGTISRFRPVVYVGVHGRLLPEHGCSEEQLFRTFSGLGYRSRFISVDHEEHWVFWDPENHVSRLRLPKRWSLKRFLACGHVPSSAGLFLKENCPSLYFRLKNAKDGKPVEDL